MKYWKYLKYIIRHKWYVAIECFKMGLFIHALTHDLSKFRPSEWIPYARFFYGTYPDLPINGKGLCKQDIQHHFDVAWLNHQHRNKHHWQYWVLHEDSGDLKLMLQDGGVLKQMACDWIGASKAIRGKTANASDWYRKVKANTLMGNVQRRYFEMLIGYVDRQRQSK